VFLSLLAQTPFVEDVNSAQSGTVNAVSAHALSVNVMVILHGFTPPYTTAAADILINLALKPPNATPFPRRVLARIEATTVRESLDLPAAELSTHLRNQSPHPSVTDHRRMC
jgi:hypothetical protein